jgi:GNAT superfamily N-acetyltransferase
LKKWDLAWKNYTRGNEIVPQKGMVTYEVIYGSLADAGEHFSDFRVWLANAGYQVKVSEKSKDNNQPLFQADKAGTSFLMKEGYDDFFAVRMPKDHPESDKIVSWFYDQGECDYVGEVDDGKRSFEVRQSKLTIQELTGVTQTNLNQSEILPATFYVLKLSGRRIGKALLEYYNSEMVESGATIIMIEILEEYRGRGYGKIFLEFIEQHVCDSGFPRIWASDTKSMWFWEKAGYDIDIDEGEKWLE